MRNPLLVFENIHTTPRRKLFRFLGVDWLATPYAWLSIPFFVGGGVAVAVLGDLSAPLAESLPRGLVFGGLLFLINVLHTVGHILSGKIVGAPMDANLVTATRHVNLYSGDQSGYGKGVHIGRSLGGPLFNLLTGLIALGASALVSDAALAFFATTSIGIGLGALGPVPSVDGWVIWGELLGLRKPEVERA
jgi:hypothetical protein